jgi:8-oxo-dGTP pyrophosphatase MutT (NUDIX family)
MRIRGALGNRQVFDVLLQHGESPELAAYRAGWILQGPLAADRDPNGELVLTVDVRPAAAEAEPTGAGRRQDSGLILAPGEHPVVRQRVAAYAVVRSSAGLLATQYSAKTAVEGRWGMPGGGIDPEEEPVAAVLRETHEETGQAVDLGVLHTVQSSHWIGRSPTGRVEDFHAVRLVYLADCPAPTEPVVHDHDGTTAAARWVPLADWPSVEWTVGWRQVLGELLGDGRGP